MARRRFTPRIASLAITLLIALTVLVPAAYLGAPHYHRWRTLNALTSDDASRRERALGYVAARASEDPRVLRGTIDELAAAPTDADFLRIAAALEGAGIWDREHVPLAPWLRWIRLLAQDRSEQARVLAAQQLADLPELASDPRVPDLLDSLLDAPEPDVRYNALVAVAALAGPTSAPPAYVGLIAEATDDPHPQVARHAWIFLGLLDPAGGFRANWLDAPPEVAEAILWAAVKTNPDEPAPAIAALRDEEAPPAIRAAAAYALHFSTAPAAVEALLDVATTPPESVTTANQRVIWRALLGLPRPNLRQERMGRLEEAFARYVMDEGPEPRVDPLALAAIYRLGIAGARRKGSDPTLSDLLAKLATVEGQDEPAMEWPLTGYKPPLLRALTVAVSKTPRPGDLLPAFRSEVAEMRNLAAVIAADRFGEEHLKEFVRRLLTEFDDQARMSGAILAGLSGIAPRAEVPGEARPVDLLVYKAAHEDIWSVQQVLRLGLWMQGRLPEMDLNDVRSLLGRDDVPTTTLLLAMLHRGHAVAAFDYLLSPLAEPRIDLNRLLIRRRWWHVVQRYLPADAPPLWLWADSRLQAFQIDVLRDWYLLHRHQLRSGRGEAREAQIE